MLKQLQFMLSLRSVLLIGFFCNLIGSIYGFYWYKDQLLQTPWYFWPVVPDSPLSSSFFTIVLWMWLRKGRVNPWLMMMAFVNCMKYGVWCVVVLGMYGVRDGGMVPENWMLVVSHAAMAVEVVLYSFMFRFEWRHLWLGAIWLFLNDFMDYVYHTHPFLEDDGLLRQVSLFTVFWSVATILIAVWVHRAPAVIKARTLLPKHREHH